MLLSPAVVSAASTPGGDITNPVVRAVDIAKPAVVRILTTVEGVLSVDFGLLEGKVDFPRDGGKYEVKLSGSGAFITSHGDVLTATHVINPPHDENLDMALRIKAAPDVAAHINQEFQPETPYTEEEAMAMLVYGFFRSEVSYGETTSEVYLSTDYLGTLKGQGIPVKAYAKVDRIKVESDVEENDLAIVHVDMEDTPSIQLGNSNDVAQQDELTMIGFPGNGDLDELEKLSPMNLLTSSVTKLFVNATKISSTDEPVIQVSGGVVPGNSGGPVLDKKGNIVGIASFYISSSGVPEGIGFLRASSTAQLLIDELKLDTKPGPFQQAWQQAFNDYASTAPGHWHKTVKEFEQLKKDYPQFLALTPYLEYAQEQAKNEKLPEPPTPKADYTWVWVVGAVVAVLISLLLIGLIVLVLVRSRSKKGAPQPPVAAQPVVSPVPQTSNQISPRTGWQGYGPQGIPSAPITPPIIPSYPSQEVEAVADKPVAQENIGQEQIFVETVPEQETYAVAAEQMVIEQASVVSDSEERTIVGQEPMMQFADLQVVDDQTALPISEEQATAAVSEEKPHVEEDTLSMKAISVEKEEPEQAAPVDTPPTEEEQEKTLHAASADA